eukprot:365616-Chlamydomonas_euryale.AAC.2
MLRAPDRIQRVVVCRWVIARHAVARPVPNCVAMPSCMGVCATPVLVCWPPVSCSVEHGASHMCTALAMQQHMAMGTRCSVT